MGIPWIATCHVRALTPDKRRWEGDTDTGEGLLITLATDLATYETSIKTAIEAKGYVLEGIRDASPLSIAPAYAKHRVEIDQSYWQISEKGLLLINGFHPVTPNTPCVETTWDQLLAPGADPLWAVVDGVNWPEAVSLLDNRNDAVCLYATPDAATKAAAPWLVRLAHDSPITALMKSRPHDKHSGILFQSKWAMEELRKHLRKFTMVWTPADNNAPIYFRFYDPRVLLDMMTALAPENWGCLTAPFTHVAAPFSQLCVLPQGAKTDREIDIFAPSEDFQGRLMRANCGPETAPTRKFSLSQEEFDQFGALQLIKSKRAMALHLHAAMGLFHTKDDCLAAAELAPGLAKKYGFASKNQVYAIARCVLIMGPDFAEKDATARTILNNRKALAWQRKNALENWLVTTMPVPQPLAKSA